METYLKEHMMLDVFSWSADLLAYSLLGLYPSTSVGIGVHYFIEDTSKILVLLVSVDSDEVNECVVQRAS